MRRQAKSIGIGPADGAPSQRQIHADLVRQTRQHAADAVVGKKSDAGLGHGEPVPLASHAMRAVQGNADPTPHHHSIDQGDSGLGEAVERPVEGVFGSERAARVGDPATAPFGHLAHIASGAKGPLRGRSDEQRIHLRVAHPSRYGGCQLPAHGIRQGVEGLRAVQGDDGRRSLDAEQDIAPSLRRRRLICLILQFDRSHAALIHKLFPFAASQLQKPRVCRKSELYRFASSQQPPGSDSWGRNRRDRELAVGANP